ncbi:Nitrilase, partial [Cladochytrium tenue]
SGGTRVRVAVAQTASKQFDFAQTLAEFQQRCGEARALGAVLVVFPEAFFGGYPKFSNFGASVGTRVPEGRTQYAAYARGAVAVPSPEADAIAAASAEAGVAAVVGIVERDGASLYCSMLYVDPVRGIVGKHRKIMPTAVERLIWGVGDGSRVNLSAHTLALQPASSSSGPVTAAAATADGRATEVRVGGAICWENMMPMLRYNYYRQGVQLYVAPTVDARDTWTHSMVHVAAESRSFVLSAVQYATVADFPDWHQAIMRDTLGPSDAADWNPGREIIGGGSCIVSPLGEVLAGPLRGRAGVLVADVDLADIVGARFDLDVTGHYSRADIFELRVHHSRDSEEDAVAVAAATAKAAPRP